MTNNYSIELAVILAAGLGSRIASRTVHHPKGFISISGQTLIERSLKILRLCGFRRVVICTGHLSSWYEGLQKNWPEVKCVKNNAYDKTGSLRSLLTLRDEIDEDFLLLESDLLYEKRAVSALKALSHEAILLSGETRAGDEVYVEEDSQHHLVTLSKNRADIHRYAGEFVGINRLSFDTYETLCRWATKHQAQSARIHYEEGLAEIRAERKIPLFKIADLIWTEIDMETQLRRAEEEIFPKLKGDLL